MATYSEIEDMRDWFIDSCGEFMARVDALNGEEPAATVQEIRTCSEKMHEYGQKLVGYLDELLIQKKRAEYS